MALSVAKWFGVPLVLGLLACTSTTDTPATGTGGVGCPIGMPGCPCTSQGACDPGLECVPTLDTCVVPEECNVGAPGCECTAAGACDAGFVCMQDVCVSEDPCNPEDAGTEGCQCTTGGACDPGLQCLSGACVSVPETSSDGSTTMMMMSTGTAASTSNVDGSTG